MVSDAIQENRFRYGRKPLGAKREFPVDTEFEQAERWKPVLLRNRFAGRSTADMTLRLGEVLAYPALGTKPQFGRPVLRA